MPIKSRLYIEDIDSFRNMRDINPALVNHFLDSDGRLNKSEDFIQIAFEQILDVAFHIQDWGGEINDLYTANMIVQNSRTPTAFLLKGPGIRSNILQIAHCGKNGDQIVRLFDSPAELFIVQFIGEISENLIRDVDSKVQNKRALGHNAWYCIINGQDTARILFAYGKIQ